MITKIWRKKNENSIMHLKIQFDPLDIESIDSKTVCLCQDTILYITLNDRILTVTNI